MHYESSWNHPLNPGPLEKLSSTKPVTGAKKVGTANAGVSPRKLHSPAMG